MKVNIQEVHSLKTILASLLILFGFAYQRITIYEPKGLKFLYIGDQIKYSVMNFGKIPYGYSVTGVVHKADPPDACYPLKKINFDKSKGHLIILADRGSCNFAEKVLNAQLIGASLVLILDNNNENVHKIFPVERTKDVLDRIHVPSLLVSKIDGDQLKTAIELHQSNPNLEAYSKPVEIAVHFDLNKYNSVSHIRLILQIDDIQSYELIEDFYEHYLNFQNIMNLKVHFKIFMNADLPFKNDECVMSGLDTYCIVKSHSDTNEIPGLISETIRQMCIANAGFGRYVDYSKVVKSKCFKGDLQIVNDFQSCTNQAFQDTFSDEERASLRECMKFGSSENDIALQNNYEETKYLMINYSPLIFINGFYYKGNFDDMIHLFETICNSYEMVPTVCYSLDSFVRAEDTNYASLIAFLITTFLVCFALMFFSIFLFWIVYKRKMKRRLTSELNDKISKALMNFKDTSDRSSCRKLESPKKMESPRKSQAQSSS